MKKELIGFAMCFMLTASTLPALSACPVDPCCDPCCDSCQIIYTTAGIINYEKAKKRTNFGVIKKEKQLNEFEKLIKKAGLKDKIDKGNYTVYAPTNNAIKSMNPCILSELKDPKNRDKLVDFVMAHMISGDKSAYCLCKEQGSINLHCCQYPVDKCNYNLRVGCSTVIVPDVKTKNGRVHVINKVLDPYE